MTTGADTADGAVPDAHPTDPAATDPATGRARWCLATRVLAAATGGWLAFVLLHHLLSGRLWLWLLVDAVPPIVFVAVPVLLLVAMPVVRVVRAPLPRPAARGIAAGAVTALVLGAGLVGLNLSALAGGEGGGPGAIRVLSWNTEYWHQYEGPERFYAYLHAHRADVYLLQEYINWDGAAAEPVLPIDDLDRLRREFPGYHIAARGELITLSRFPIVAQPPVGPDRAVQADPDATYPEIFTAAKVLRTDLRVGSTLFSAYNVHIPVQFDLHPSRLLTRLPAHHAQRRDQFRGLEADVAANPNPALIAGDFNTSPAMGELSRLRDMLTDAAAAGGPLFPASWPANGWPRLWRLDWAFTTAGARARQYRIVDTAGMSDHRAQTVGLDLTP